MKKFLYIILVSCFSLAIISCAEKDESTAEKDESTTTATTTTTTTTLSAPSTLTATGGTGQVTLDWTSVSGASSYTVYWDNTSGISSSSTAITSVSTDNYTHSGLDHGITNYYKVAAVDSAVTGTLSSEASARTSILLGGSIQGEEIILGGKVTTFAGPPAGTTTSGDTDNATASNARFYMPYGITTDGTNLYVSDSSNNKIRKIVISSGEVTTLAGPPAGTTTSGSTDNATASNARFNRPAGIVTDGTNLYVADWQGNKIRKIVISSGEVTTIAGPPAGTTTSGDTDNDTPSNARFKQPFGMTTDGINLFVSDVGNNKIRKIVISSGKVTTIAGPPAGTSASGDTDNDTASNARFNLPYGISSDGSYIYVGDFNNNKIRRIE